MKWVFCDIETFSVYKNATIPSLGVLAIDINKDALYFTFEDCLARADMVKLDMVEQRAKDRHIMKETLDFWQKQSPEAQQAVTPDPENDISIMEFHGWLEQFGDLKGATWWFLHGTSGTLGTLVHGLSATQIAQS
jgi:hypothetical protein